MPIDPDRYYTTADVAELARVSVDTIESWRADGYGPRWHRLPGRVLSRQSDAAARGRRRATPRYKGCDVIAWLESCAVEMRGAVPPTARKARKARP